MDLREVEVGGRRTRYRVTGAGEPLVLVHGLAGSWRWWSPLLRSLAQRRRVHVVNLPRLRPTELGAWLEHWLDALGMERVDIAGHSLGGLIATELAASREPRTRRLVLVTPAGIPCGRSLARRTLPLLGTLNGIRASLPMVVADALHTGPLSLMRGIAFVSTRDLRDTLSRVRAPTLLVWGERDDLVPLAIAEEWHRRLPDSRLVCLSCGHVPMLEAPRELADHMLSFLADEVADDSGDQVGSRVMDGVGFVLDEDEPSAR
jgi:pimeloyl-ACP methyl ester carboxylesterase